jgi:hypothetical protein
MFLRYKLHRTPMGNTTPPWVEDPGHFYDPDDQTLIGYTPDEGDRDYWVPDTVTNYTQTELVTYVLDLHSRYPILQVGAESPSDPSETPSAMTNDEVTAFVNAWATAVSS